MSYWSTRGGWENEARVDYVVVAPGRGEEGVTVHVGERGTVAAGVHKDGDVRNFAVAFRYADGWRECSATGNPSLAVARGIPLIEEVTP